MNVIETDAPTLDFLRDQVIVKVLYMNLDRPYLERIRRALGRGRRPRRCELLGVSLHGVQCQGK